MSKLNVSFDLPRPYTGPIHSSNKGHNSVSRNQSQLDNSFKKESPNKHMSFSPTMTLAEYNQVKFSKNGQPTRLPDLTMPQRVDLPSYFNTPLRIMENKPKSRSPSPQRKKTNNDSSFIGDALNNSAILNKSRQDIIGTENRSKSVNKRANFIENEIQAKQAKRVRNVNLIAQECRRAEMAREALQRKINKRSKMLEVNNTSYLLEKSHQDLSFTETKPKPENKYPNIAENGAKVGTLRRLRDLSFLAQACKRAEKTREEGRAYYSMGVLYDNLKEYRKAIQYYKKFLTLCRNTNDVNGEALAYNCLAVDYQLLSEEGDMEMFQQALRFHEKHKDASNISGKFIAHINMGLLYSSIGDEKNAILNQQQALRYAVELSDTNCQTVAVGSLGKVGTLELAENRTRMLAFVEKFLNFCKNMNDRKSEGDAYLKMGQILADEKNYADGMKNYQKALELGRAFSNNEIIEKAKLGYGITKGMATIDNYFDSMKKNFGYGS